MQLRLNKFIRVFFEVWVRLALIWVILALLIDAIALTLHFMDREDITKEIINRIV